MVNIREKTCLVIKKNGKYYVGNILGTQALNWSDSLYDAWRTRKVDKASEKLKETGGTLMLFNPIVGQIREFA